MKKTIKILAVIMIVAMLSVSLVACSKIITGKYSTEVLGTTITYEFGLFGNVTKTTYTPKTLLTDEQTTVVKGKYEILEDPENPDNLIIAFEFEGEERTTSSFVQGEEGGVKYIKIDGFQFNAVK